MEKHNTHILLESISSGRHEYKGDENGNLKIDSNDDKIYQSYIQKKQKTSLKQILMENKNKIKKEFEEKMGFSDEIPKNTMTEKKKYTKIQKTIKRIKTESDEKNLNENENKDKDNKIKNQNKTKKEEEKNNINNEKENNESKKEDNEEEGEENDKSKNSSYKFDIKKIKPSKEIDIKIKNDINNEYNNNEEDSKSINSQKENIHNLSYKKK